MCVIRGYIRGYNGGCMSARGDARVCECVCVLLVCVVEVVRRCV